jgi:hypothetical protein
MGRVQSSLGVCSGWDLFMKELVQQSMNGIADRVKQLKEWAEAPVSLEPRDGGHVDCLV